MPIQKTARAIGREQPPFAQVEVGHRRGVGVAPRAEADSPVETKHVGGAEDDPGGRNDRRPGRRVIGSDQAQELADEIAGAGKADAGHGEDHEQQGIAGHIVAKARRSAAISRVCRRS